MNRITQFPDMDESELRGLIRKEYRLCNARKLCFDGGHRMKALSLTTVKSYSRQLREQARGPAASTGNDGQDSRCIICSLLDVSIPDGHV